MKNGYGLSGGIVREGAEMVPILSDSAQKRGESVPFHLEPHQRAQARELDDGVGCSDRCL